MTDKTPSPTHVSPTAPHLRACALDVNWRLERKGHKGRHRDRVWLLHCHGDQRRFKTLAGAQRAIFDELETCFSYARVRPYLEAILAAPSHPFHRSILAWLHGAADPLNEHITELFKSLPPPEVDFPSLWTAEDRRALEPRAHSEERLQEYLQRKRAGASALALVQNLETSPPTSTVKGRHRL